MPLTMSRSTQVHNGRTAFSHLATQSQHAPLLTRFAAPNPRTSWLGKISLYNSSYPTIPPTKIHLHQVDHEQRTKSILLVVCAYSIVHSEAGMYNVRMRAYFIQTPP